MVAVFRILKGFASLRTNDSKYFVGDGATPTNRSHFRQDLHAIVGGALAAAFVASALGGYVDFPHISNATLTLIAGFIGAVGGKYILV